MHCGVHIDEKPLACTAMKKTSGFMAVRDFKRGKMQKQKELGSGSYGTVYSAMDPSGKEFAIKYMNLEFNTVSSSMLHELEVIHFNDPNIISACMVGYVNREKYEDEGTAKDLEISMDMAHFDLGHLIYMARTEIPRVTAKTYPTFDPTEMKYLAYEVLRSIAVIHGRLVNHCDIKPENYLIAARSVPTMYTSAGIGDTTMKTVMLADFGISSSLYKGPFTFRTVYSLWYRPPELLLGNPPMVTHLADVWAAACVLYEMATGYPLFDGSDESDQIKKIALLVGTDKLRDKQKSTLFGKLPPDYTQYSSTWNIFYGKLRPHMELANLLKKMLEPNPFDRCTIFQALENEYFTGLIKYHVQTAIPEIKNVVPVRYDPNTLMVDKHDAIRIFLEIQREYDRDKAHKYSNPMINDAGMLAQMIDTGTLLKTYTEKQKCGLFIHAMTLAKRYIKSGRTKFVLDGQLYRSVAIAAMNISQKYLFNDEDTIADEYSSTTSTSTINWYDVMQMERDILESNEFDLSIPTSCDYLDVMINPTEMDVKKCYDTLLEIEKIMFVRGDEFMNRLPRRIITPHETAALCIIITTKNPVDMFLDPKVIYIPPIDLLKAFITTP